MWFMKAKKYNLVYKVRTAVAHVLLNMKAIAYLSNN